MADGQQLGLFDAYGVELEYMIVDRTSLNVLPVTDRLLEMQCGRIESEVEVGPLAWSNELVLHVVELKTAGPADSLAGLASEFHAHVARIDGMLAQIGGRLMPSAMHPWMDPFREMVLWPHEYSPVYEAFNRIFDCRGHGWANLQSVHLNLPFSGDAEFGRLHAAIRLILPLLPALAAASPVMDGRLSGRMDNRLHVYRSNSVRVPQVAGLVIPEPAYSQADYEQLIMQPLYRAIAPLDTAGVLQDEFLNARGAIARFGRGSIEIRVIDIQENPFADLAVLRLVVAVLRALVAEDWSSLATQQQFGVEPLHRLLLQTIDDAERAPVTDTSLLHALGIFTTTDCSAGDVWRSLADRLAPALEPQVAAALDAILTYGPLARRLLKALGATPDKARMADVYRQLCDCLLAGVPFVSET